VTDANLVLGRLDPQFFPSIFGPKADQPLDKAAAYARLSELARAMGQDHVEAVAEGFVAVTVEQTAQAVRRISTERGFDPRDHALVAFGGAAGQTACQAAEALGISTILCPRYGSVLSAWGIGQAKISSLRQAGLDAPLDENGLSRARHLASSVQARAQQALADQGCGAGTIQTILRLRYDGADAELPVPMADLKTIRSDFESAHARLFGFIEADRTILIATVEVEATAESDPLASKPFEAVMGPDRRQTITMFAHGRRHAAPVIPANALQDIEGPALIIRTDTQIAVAPGWRANREANDLIRLTRLDCPQAEPLEAKRPDPITLELFNRRFMGVAEAMGAAWNAPPIR